MLGTFSFEPYFKSYRWFTIGSLEFLEIASRSLFPFLQLACLLLLPPPLFSADLAVEGQPGHLLLRAGTHASLPTFSTARCLALVLSPLCHAPTPSPAAATSPSWWRARCRDRRSLLARARALQVPQHSIPPALSLAPHSDAPEHRRRSAEHRRAQAHRRPASPQLLHPR